jgi:hypothetical protein
MDIKEWMTVVAFTASEREELTNPLGGYLTKDVVLNGQRYRMYIECANLTERENTMSTSASEHEIEATIRSKGLTGRRITPEHIEKQIADEVYWLVPNTTVTVCALTLQNGFVVIGESACADRANFDEEIGKAIARRDARERIWALEGYLLRNEIFLASAEI